MKLANQIQSFGFAFLLVSTLLSISHSGFSQCTAFQVTGGGAYCEGEGGVSVGLNGSELEVNYQLLLNGGAIGSPVPGTGAALSFGNQSTEGAYTVQATGTCGNDVPMGGSAQISINSLPVATITPEGPTTFCSGGSVTLTANSSSGYAWSIGATSQSILVNTSGDFTVTVSDANNCSATSDPVSVSVNTVGPGTISGSQVICNGGDPSAFTQTPGSGAGTLSYQWQSSLNNTDFTDIDGETGLTYDVSGGVTQTSYFRRVATSILNGVSCSAASNVLTITVNNINPGTITSDQTVCNGGDPGSLISLVGASGTGSVTFQWELSEDNINFTNILNSGTSGVYNPPAGLTVTTYYRRRATSTVAGVGCSDYSNTIIVTVLDVDPGIIGSDQVICSGGDPQAFTSENDGSGSAPLTYQWQFAGNPSFANPSNIGGATNVTYDPPAGLTSTRYYRRTVTSTLNGRVCSAVSNIVTVSVNAIAAGSISANQTFCEGGGDPVPFAEVTSAVPGPGATLSYQWQISLNNVDFSNIAGASGAGYDETATITQTTYYRRLAISTINGFECSSPSNTLTVRVNIISPGAINTTTQTICSGGDPANILSTALPSGVGTLAYQWQSSIDNSQFNNIVGATSVAFDPPSGLSETTYFRRMVTYTNDGVTCSAATTPRMVVVQGSVNPGSVGSDQLICGGGNPAAFVELSAASGTGTLSYRWQISTNNVTFTNIGGATNSTYDAPAGLNATSYYRRMTVSTVNGVACEAPSNSITVTVNTVNSGGNFPSPVAICIGGSANLSQNNPKPSGAGELSYQWQISPNGSNSWTNITGATGLTYTTPALYSTSYYRRIITSLLSGLACEAQSNVITVTVSGTSSFQSTSDGNWTSGSSWGGGAVPGQTSGTLSCPVVAQHELGLTTGISVSTGVFNLGVYNIPAPGTITVSGVNVTGVGTNFTSALVGKRIFARSAITFGAADASVGIVTSVISPTQLTVNKSSDIPVPTVYYIGTNVTDPPGGSYHSLTMNRGNSNNNPVNGILELKSGTANFENGATMSATNLIVRAGATLILGPLKCNICDPGDPAYNATECAKAEYNDCRQTRLTTGSASYIYIEKYGRIIVYGNVVNNSQTGPIVTNGLLYIVGGYSSTGTQDIVQETIGEGDIYTTGPMTTKGNSTVFEFRDVDCGSACSGNALRCGFTTTISPSGQVAYCASLNVTLTGTTSAAYSFDMEWERSTTSASAGFDVIPGTKTTISSGPKEITYPVLSNTGSTWYRVRVDGAKADATPCSGYSSPVEIVSGGNVWTGGPAANGYIANEWHNPANWCNGTLPTEIENVSINADQVVVIFRKGLDGNTPAIARNVNIFDGANVSLTSASSELNIYGDLFTAGGTLDGSLGTLKFLAGEASSTVQGTGVVIVNDVEVQSGKALKIYDDLTIRGNTKFREIGTNVDLLDATLVFSGNAAQTFPGTGLIPNLEVRNLRIEKTGGSVSLDNKVALLGNLTFDVSANSTLNFSGNLVIASRTGSTDDDGKIGSIPAGITLTGNVTAERWMTPVAYAPYRYISSPVSGPGLLNSLKAQLGNKIQRYDPSSRFLYSAATSIEPGGGYVAETSFGNNAWTLTGEVNRNIPTWNMPTAGWYLIGNPYPAPIRWSNSADAWELSNIASIVAVTDNSESALYPSYFRYFDYEDTDQEWGSNNLNQGVIAMGQAFWVYSLGNGSLTIKEQAKELTTSSSFYREKKEGHASDQLVISVSNGSFADQALLLIEDPAKKQLKQPADLEKLLNPRMNVYLIPKGSNLLRHSTSGAIERLPIGIQVDQAGDYQLSFPNAAQFGQGGSVYLIDAWEGIATALSSTPYRFSVFDISRPVENRFYLSNSPEIKWDPETAISFYPNPVNDKLNIRLSGIPGSSQLAILDASGKVIHSRDLEGAGVIETSTLPAGIYIVKIQTSKGLYWKRIIKY